MNTIIVDDDPRYAASCKDELTKLAAKHKVELAVHVVESGQQLLFEDDLLASADLIYMDEHMPGKSGMETAAELRLQGVSSDIVFYTVDESRAIDAFDVEALHYIVKGKTTGERFENVFLKAEDRSRRRHVETLLLSCAGDHRSIDIRSIRFFEVKNRIITVVYEDEGAVERFEFYSTLSKLEELLFGKGFVRLHRGYLVQRARIVHVSKTEALLATGEKIPIGRTYRSDML